MVGRYGVGIDKQCCDGFLTTDFGLRAVIYYYPVMLLMVIS